MNKLSLEAARGILSNGIVVNGLILSCILYFASVTLSHYYSWDIDQFMYFGSRLANGELAFIREYDDKSVPVHALFVIPFWLRSIRAWYIISMLAVLISAYSLYKTLAKYERNAKSQAIIAAMYFAFLMTSTRGGINHINGIAACMTLIYMNGIALSAKRNPIVAAYKIPIYVFLAAWSISIRPYYILTTLAVISWPAAKSIMANIYTREKSKNGKIFWNNLLINSLKTIALLATFIASINFLPYILTGEGKALADAIAINKISITPSLQEGIIRIFIIGLQKAPLIISPLLASNLLLILNIFRCVKERGFNTRTFLERNLDLIYAGSIMPFLLALMISTRHFHYHYVVLFAPFSAITLYLLLTRKYNSKTNSAIYRKSRLNKTLRKASRVTVLLGLSYHCIYPIVKINEQFLPWSKLRTQGRENILEELEALTRENGKNKSFIVTRDNHFHWRLNQSRMGMPHASLLSKIASSHGNVGQAASEASKIRTKFKYPNTNQVCKTMLEAKPFIYLVPKNTIEDECLSKGGSYYSRYKEVERGHNWNRTKTKIGIIYIQNI